MSDKKKSLKLGQIKKSKEGHDYITLGNIKNKDPKYNFTVQVRVLEGNPQNPEEVKKAKVLGYFTNPNIGLYKPNDGAPSFIVNDLVVKLPEE